MSIVRVVTDSTAQLDPKEAEELGVTVVPLEIAFGSQKFQEGVDLTSDEFFQRVAHSPVMPVSNPPSVEAFRRVYAALNETTDQVLSLHVSSKINATCTRARSAADYLLGRCEIAVLDSWTISLGLSILVKAAAQAAAQGESLDDVVRHIRGMIPHVYAVFFTNALDYLQRDQHLTRSQALLGKMLNIRPFLAVEEGKILPMEKVRTRDKVIDKLLEFVSEFSRIERIAVIRSPLRASRDTQLLLDRLESNFPEHTFETLTYGPTLATHIGPSSLGLIVYEGLEP